MKIAQLVPYYWPAIGGVEVVCQCISEELVKRGHQVDVFTCKRTHKGTPALPMASRETINGVNVHRFKGYVNVGHYSLFPGVIPELYKGGFDIIHTHGYRQPQSEIGSIVGSSLNIPTILHVHGGFYTESKAKRFFYDAYDRFARSSKVNRFDHFITLSEADRDRMLALNADDEKISIIRNAAENSAFEKIDPSAFKRKYGLENEKIILYLGILNSFKRPDLLIRALPFLREKVPEVFVLFVGPDAGEVKRINEIAEALDVTQSYKWIGPLRGKEKHEALEAAEFLALPADEDPYPLVLLEAMAHGKPVLTTNVVGQASIISANKAGIIVAPGNSKAIEEAAHLLLTDEAYSRAIGSNARKLAEQTFSVASVVDEIEGLYTRLIENKRKQA